MLRVIGLVLLIFALARPRYENSKSNSFSEGIDIVLCIDLSTSMLAEDFQPKNRIEAAKMVAASFIDNRVSDRIGLVVFQAKAFTQCPITTDYNLLKSLLGQLRAGQIEEDGTAIGTAIATATNRLRDSKAKSRVIILLTDGQNNAGEVEPITAAHLASALGIKIYTVGAGSRGYANYPFDDPIFGRRYMKVKVDVDDESLTKIASITGGKYFRATDLGSLEETYKEIDQLEKTKVETEVFKEIRAFGAERVVEKLTASLGREKIVMKSVLFVLAFVLLGISMINPQIGTRLKEVKRKGIELVIALDISNSMLATDVSPSRLQRAKYELSDMVDALGGDLVGLVVFAGTAFQQSPMTSDHSALKLFLEIASPDLIQTQGTNFSAALETAMNTLEQGEGGKAKDEKSSHVIVIVSDGENNEEGVAESIKKVKEKGIKVFTVGIGSEQGAPIPLMNREGEIVDYKREESGAIVTTKFNENTLVEIARKADGEFYRVSTGGSNFDQIIEKFKTLDQTEYETKQLVDYDDKFQFFLLSAILLLIVEFLIGEKKVQSKAFAQYFDVEKGNEHFQAGQLDKAKEYYDKVESENEDIQDKKEAVFNNGNVFFQKKEFDKAKENFSKLASQNELSSEDRADAYYNLANTAYEKSNLAKEHSEKQKALKESLDYLKESMKLNSTDNDAKQNYEFIKRQLQQLNMEQQKNNQNKDKDKKEKQEDKKKEQEQSKDDQSDKNKDGKKDGENKKNEQQNQEEKNSQPQNQKEFSKQQAERLLDAIKQDEKNMLKKYQQRQAKTKN
ncbi:hypothetical protein CHS0354_000702 [Potamilus streckersoni]|uniref:VWFA domain-containing protein n=1 Tax=Potamilus streckersoni TaxID=2493646 RepID=A0AAE0T7F3_9BIVA|nr:hypothetical protein CHS0354_000702 [Potamilus streckersoni]